jgi:hypothetical protein
MALPNVPYESLEHVMSTRMNSATIILFVIALLAGCASGDAGNPWNPTAQPFQITSPSLIAPDEWTNDRSESEASVSDEAPGNHEGVQNMVSNYEEMQVRMRIIWRKDN